MKGIIFKLVVVFMCSVIISSSIGMVFYIELQNADVEYISSQIDLENYTPISLAVRGAIFSFLCITFLLIWFYIINIAILVSTYKGTKKIENKDIIYQRDLADDYNSAIASYIIDGTIEAKQDYQAVIVELESKNLIYKEDGKYKVNQEKYKTMDDLLNNQIVVLRQINEGKVSFAKFKNAIMQDAKELGYVELNKKLLVVLVIMAIINTFSMLIILYIVIFARPYMNALTEKGKKEKDKILKLKQYLINFSNIHELEKSDNNIWGEYLAYAISLNVNKKIKVKRIRF